MKQQPQMNSSRTSRRITVSAIAFFITIVAVLLSNTSTVFAGTNKPQPQYVYKTVGMRKLTLDMDYPPKWKPRISVRQSFSFSVGAGPMDRLSSSDLKPSILPSGASFAAVPIIASAPGMGYGQINVWKMPAAPCGGSAAMLPSLASTQIALWPLAVRQVGIWPPVPSSQKESIHRMMINPFRLSPTPWFCITRP